MNKLMIVLFSSTLSFSAISHAGQSKKEGDKGNNRLPITSLKQSCIREVVEPAVINQADQVAEQIRKAEKKPASFEHIDWEPTAEVSIATRTTPLMLKLEGFVNIRVGEEEEAENRSNPFSVYLDVRDAGCKVLGVLIEPTPIGQ